MKSFVGDSTFLTTATEFAVADLLTLTLQNGTVIHATNADIDLTWQSVLYSSTALKFSRSKFSTATGGKVADLELTIYADSATLLQGIPILQAIRAHALDGAIAQIDALFLQDWKTPKCSVNSFYGKVAGIEAGRTSAKVTVKAPTHLFDTQMPRNFFQPGCLHTLFDPGCTVNRASYAVPGVIQAGSGGVTINDALLTQANGYFTRGYLVFTSGQNSGLSYTVAASVASAGVTLVRPLYYPISNGDTFTIYPGCDHTQATCNSKFSNLVNFRAFPYTPVAETAI